MIAELEALKTQVERNTHVDESAVILLDAIKAKLDDMVENAEDLEEFKAKVSEFSSALGGSTDNLASAVERNTTPAPQPEPEPEPEPEPAPEEPQPQA